MKIAGRSTRDEHVRISRDIAEDEAFRRYLAMSRDSYPMGIGRIVAICVHVLQYERRIYSRFELDRAVQWPADRSLSFGAVLEAVGWAKSRSATMWELDLPPLISPRKPYQEQATFRSSIHGRDSDGTFMAKAEVESRLMTKQGRPVVLITMDGMPRDGIESLINSTNEKPITLRRARNGRGPIVRR